MFVPLLRLDITDFCPESGKKGVKVASLFNEPTPKLTTSNTRWTKIPKSSALHGR